MRQSSLEWNEENDRKITLLCVSGDINTQRMSIAAENFYCLWVVASYACSPAKLSEISVLPHHRDTIQGL
jgi:hypothetical protein